LGEQEITIRINTSKNKGPAKLRPTRYDTSSMT